jgi:hypothetical protein
MALQSCRRALLTPMYDVPSQTDIGDIVISDNVAARKGSSSRHSQIASGSLLNAAE